ncbi:beta-ketoacyl-ACP synthase III [Beggiatoa leptomitoformis]|uniref:Beta-ketoacyl-[acyl-carrier-protein] synthase III n=1 Tax=Beggiatoa leptomitoformis TaxID=288004 RepID=A0A2N9YEU4_9GAMM|nr:beta-ketoacyl-ACP synthase III [Beggiatoa leptomitoformis]ALG68770.1 beta-ketoacyl-ACP synthase III [Beggiatoa leptomitoformis]AUI68869.1 beta-ketoacyl-ACP synthase III [Beggiatoa leptomitoformis]
MIYSRIAGTGSYLPARVVTNADLAKVVDTSDEWIIERTGIHQRHIVADGEGTCDMAEHAARRALAVANCSPSDIDLIILGTTTPDCIYPSTACLLQARLGNHTAAAFDVQAVCSGFIYALSIADKFIKSGSAKRVLVVGAETYSRILNWQDRNTCVLFGDGAGAVVLEASEQAGILSTHLHADGSYKDYLHVPGRVEQGKIRGGDGFTTMQGTEVFKFAVKVLSEVVDEALQANQLQAKDIDWLVPHQANIRIISATAKKLKMPMEQVIVTVPEHGNTSAASIPLALDTAVRDGRIQRGQTLLLEGIGGGFTWGAVLVRY